MFQLPIELRLLNVNIRQVYCQIWNMEIIANYLLLWFSCLRNHSHFTNHTHTHTHAHAHTKNRAKIQVNLNERVLSTREPCTYEYVSLLQSFNRVTLIINSYIAQNFYATMLCLTYFFALLRLPWLAYSWENWENVTLL